MQVSSLQSSALSLASSLTAVKKNDSTTATASKPEDFLTDDDVKMIEYVSGTTSLADAENNPNAKALAFSLGTKRENGAVQGDVSKNYYYSQLTQGDAAILEHATGTTTIIDAMAKSTLDERDFAMDVAVDREQGTLSGNITDTYLNSWMDSNQSQLDYVSSMKTSTNASDHIANISVSSAFLAQAETFIDSEKTTGAYSASA